MEFAKAYRLTEVVIEPWSFTVPRVKVITKNGYDDNTFNRPLEV